MRTNQKDPRYKDIGIKKCCANQVEIKQKVFFKSLVQIKLKNLVMNEFKNLQRNTKTNL
jgi:hypothetical protein